MGSSPGWAETALRVPAKSIGGVMAGGTVGEVVASNNPAFKPGDFVEDRLGWQEYVVTSGSMLRKLDPAEAPISTANGILGMPGMTAWFGLFEIGKPKPGETVVVSAASGAVGQVVGQLAKRAGAHVVGIAGGAKKCAFVKDEFGFDACIDYKAVNDLAGALKSVCPDGIDVYFDNVGGPIADAHLSNRRSGTGLCRAFATLPERPVDGSAAMPRLFCLRENSAPPPSGAHVTYYR